jgi:pimeloyl-ACP methyl ester carboxylesterase
MASHTDTFTQHRIIRPDGRTVAVAETGDPVGSAVVLAHPAPGSRLLDPDPAATRAAGVRLISVDRPGYGGSTPVADGVPPAIPSHADDIAATLEALGVSDVAAVGWSAGGRVVLALAARHPDLVRAPAIGFYGADDETVPPAHGEWYAGQVPGADLRVVAGIGHLVALTRWADILAAVA